MNREAWLQAAVEKLRPIFADRAELEVPPVHVSAGWPSKGGTGTKKRVIGQCWDAVASSDGTPHVFISPMLSGVEPVAVLETLAHELVHATVGCDAKHGARFGRPARAIGLEGKMTATSAGEELRAALLVIAADLGPYPHAAIEPGGSTSEPKQGTRMLKVVAGCCGYTVRTTRKWLDEGLPSCPCGNRMEEADA